MSIVGDVGKSRGGTERPGLERGMRFGEGTGETTCGSGSSWARVKGVRRPTMICRRSVWRCIFEKVSSGELEVGSGLVSRCARFYRTT